MEKNLNRMEFHPKKWGKNLNNNLKSEGKTEKCELFSYPYVTLSFSRKRLYGA